MTHLIKGAKNSTESKRRKEQGSFFNRVTDELKAWTKRKDEGLGTYYIK